MSETYRQYLHELANKYIPHLPREIILATEEPFIQAAHELLLPSYIRNNMCLMGDAGILLRPHTAAGATKAIQDALALSEQLTISPNIKSALKIWNDKQHHFGASQFGLGQTLGKMFVTDVPDWHLLTRTQVDEMWQKAAGDVCWYKS